MCDTIIQMMGANALLTIMAVATLVLAVVLNKTNTQKLLPKEAKAPESAQVLSEQDQNEDSPTPSPAPSPSPSVAPSATAKPTSTASPASSGSTSVELNQFWYPSANVILRSDNSFTLSSFDNVDKIIEWYQNKLTELKMPAKSVAKTNTNGNVLAKLAGAKNGLEVQIEVKQSSSDSLVSIKVDISK